jgi:chitodextrinase
MKKDKGVLFSRDYALTVTAIAVTLVVLLFVSVATVQAAFGPVTNLGTGREPHCALGPNGMLHVVYITDTVKYVKLDGGVPSAVETLPGSSSGRNPFICVGTDGSVHVVWDTWSTAYYTNKVGGSWKTPQALPKHMLERNYFAQVALASNGVAYTSHWSATKDVGGYNLFSRVTNTGSATPTITQVYLETAHNRPPAILGPTPISSGDGNIHIFTGQIQTTHWIMDSNGGVTGGENISRTPVDKTGEGLQGYFVGTDPGITASWWGGVNNNVTGQIVNTLSRANSGKQGLIAGTDSGEFPYPRAAYDPVGNKVYVLFAKANKPALSSWVPQQDTVQQLGNVSESTLSTGTRGPGAGGIAPCQGGGVNIVYSTGGTLYHRTMDATSDDQPPSVPSNVQAVGMSSTRVNITWTASTDNVGVTGYKIYRNGTQVGDSATTSYSDTGLTASTTYSYTVSAYDAWANESAQSSPPAQGTTLPPDTQPPSVPTNVVAATESSSTIFVMWNASTDNVGVTGYRIFRNGTQVGTSVSANFLDSGLLPGTTYSYTISAYDDSGNNSAQSSPPATATTQTASTFCSIDLGATDVNNMLTRVVDPDGDTTATDAGGLNCRKPLASGDHYFYFDVGNDFLSDTDQTTYLEVAYYDDQSSSIYFHPEYDSAYPTDEYGGQGQYKQAPMVFLSGTNKWKTATWQLDRCRFAGRQNAGADFRLFVGTAQNVKIDSVRISLIPYEDYVSVTRDLGANEVYEGISHPSNWTDSNGDTTVVDKGGRSCRKPLASGDNYFYFNVSDAIIYNGSPSTVYLKLAYYDSPGGFIEPQYDSTSSAYTSATRLNFTGTNSWKEAEWTLTNCKFANSQNGSADFRLYVGTDQSVHIDKVTVSKEPFPAPDAEPPSVPTGIQAIGQSTTSILVSWTASTDNVGVTGYEVYRNTTQVGTSSATNYTDTGLSASTSYSYTVSAYDAVGNHSAQSAPPVVGTTLEPDTTPPSVPTNVSATVLSISSVELSWTASTDNRGVLGYKVQRDGIHIGTVSTTSYTDTGLTAGTTYSYTVSAYDEDGNDSAQSSPPTVAQTLLESDVPKYGIFEVTLTASGSYSNPYLQMPGDNTTPGFVVGTFNGPGGVTIQMDGFWDGGNVWKIRMTPTVEGYWTYSTSSSDSGLNGDTGSFNCVASTSKGFPKVDPTYGHHFAYDDGTPFYLGSVTTQIAAFVGNDGAGGRIDDGTFQAMLDARAAQGFTSTHWGYYGFNKPNFNNQTQANEGGPPFTNYDPTRLNPSYHQFGDLRVQAVHDRGMISMFTLGWPDQNIVANIGHTSLKRYWRYLIARYAAYNVTWNLFGEVQEFGANYLTIADDYGNLTRQKDPYNHLLSTHTCGDPAADFCNRAWVDYIMLQRPTNVTQNWLGYNKPVVNTEYGGYEGFQVTGEQLRPMIWDVRMRGGYFVYEIWIDGINSTGATYCKWNNKFFQERTKYWLLEYHPELFSSRPGLADPATEYVIYLSAGGNITVNLSAASGTLNVEWFNPRTGVATAAGTTTGGASRSFTAPDTNDWVLHISKPADSEAPSVPTNVQAIAQSASSVQVTWTASTDNIGVTGYKVYRNGMQAGTSATTSYTDTGLSAGTTYSYRVSAYDAAGNESAQSSPPAVVTPVDTTPPSVPTNVQATAQSSTSIQITWTASTDDVGVTGYRVFRNGSEVGTTAGTSYADTGLESGVTYSYGVSAYDAAGNESAQSSPPAVAATPDDVPPSVPGNVQAVEQSPTSIQVTWTASTDNVGVTGYRVFRDGLEIDTSTTTSYTDTGLDFETTYSYTVSAYDAAGNESLQSAPAAVVTTSSAGGAGQKGVVGGIGLNNIGLLVRLWGQFIYVDASSFLLDDGGGTPVKCIVPPDVTIDPGWQYVGVTGISSCYKSGDDIIRLLKVRDASDISAY